MKTKIRLSILILGLILSCKNGNAQNAKQASVANKEVIEMLKAFYTQYITESSKKPQNAKKIDAIFDKYCVPTLLEDMQDQELDYDPFLNAQDSDTVMLKTLKITNYPKSTNTYIVSYADLFNKKSIKIKLHVQKSKTGYKIDKIYTK